MHNSPTFNPAISTDYYENASYNWTEDSRRYMNTVSAHTRANYLYMQECGHFKTNYPYYTERASLPSYLLLYTICGKGVLTYHNQKYFLAEGCCCFIDCMNPHRYEIAKESGKEGQQWEFLWVHFHGMSAEGYYEEFAGNNSPVIQIQDTFLIESNLRRIIAIHQKKAVYGEVLTANVIHTILTELLIQRMTDFNEHFHIPDDISQAISFIQTHYTEEISLEDIAGQVNLSKFHLAREFSKYMGISMNQYVINCRISRAKELLRESNLPVSEIAFLVGIPHVSHFIQLFKEREGVTPLKYRKLW